MWNNGMIFFVTIWIESFCTSGNRIGQTMAQMDSSIPKSNAFNFPVVERKKKKDKNFFFSRFFFRYTKPMASFVCLHIASDNSWRSLSNAFLGGHSYTTYVLSGSTGGHFVLTFYVDIFGYAKPKKIKFKSIL